MTSLLIKKINQSCVLSFFLISFGALVACSNSKNQSQLNPKKIDNSDEVKLSKRDCNIHIFKKDSLRDVAIKVNEMRLNCDLNKSEVNSYPFYVIKETEWFF